MARNDPTIYMRIPQELKDKLDVAALENRRSLTAEVVARLEATFDETVVTTVEARVKHGAEEKRFEFNADEIADKVVERLEGRERKRANKVIIREGDRLPVQPISADMLELYQRVSRALASIDYEALPPRGNEPYGPQKSSYAKRSPPTHSKKPPASKKG